VPKTLFILNDPPYGTERCHDGLRLALSLARREEEGVRRSSLAELTDWTAWSGRVLVF